MKSDRHTLCYAALAVIHAAGAVVFALEAALADAAIAVCAAVAYAVLMHAHLTGPDHHDPDPPPDGPSAPAVAVGVTGCGLPVQSAGAL